MTPMRSRPAIPRRALTYFTLAFVAVLTEALLWHSRAGYRLRAVGNFGEPLVPRANYELMDALYRAPSAAAAAAYFPWADIASLLTPEPVSGGGLTPAGRTLWNVSRDGRAAGAWALSPEVFR